MQQYNVRLTRQSPIGAPEHKDIPVSCREAAAVLIASMVQVLCTLTDVVVDDEQSTHKDVESETLTMVFVSETTRAELFRIYAHPIETRH